MKKLMSATVLVVALLATLGSASDEDGGGASGGDATTTTVSSGEGETTEAGGTETTVAGETTAPGGGGTAGDADEVDDVTITACGKDDVLGFGTATIQVVNDSSEPSSYFIDIAFESPDGATQLGTGAAVVNGLAPGQTTTQEVSSLSDAGDGEITCRVASVERLAA